MILRIFISAIFTALLFVILVAVYGIIRFYVDYKNVRGYQPDEKYSTGGSNRGHFKESVGSVASESVLRRIYSRLQGRSQKFIVIAFLIAVLFGVAIGVILDFGPQAIDSTKNPTPTKIQTGPSLQ